MNMFIPSQIRVVMELLHQQTKTLYLTAPHAGAGTTTCTFAIAKHLSSNYCKKVVVIDGNPSSSCLSQQLGLHASQGMFSDSADSENDIKNLVQPVPGHSFHLVPCETGQAMQYRFSEKNLEGCLETLRGDFDMILYDAPPVYGQNSALNLAPLFDGTLLIVDAKATRKEVAESAREQLQQLGVTITGAILNQRQYHVPKWLYNML